jgi:hypothetical protein
MSQRRDNSALAQAQWNAALNLTSASHYSVRATTLAPGALFSTDSVSLRAPTFVL